MKLPPIQGLTSISNRTMKTVAIAFASAAVLLSTIPHVSQAAELARDDLLMPFIPHAARLGINLPSRAIDPNQPIWVSYSLLAVSASEKPAGELVVDASFEGIPANISDAVVVFYAKQMNSFPPTGTLGAVVEAQVGKRSPEETVQALGPELNAAYQALLDKKGAIYGQTIVKKFPPLGHSEARLLVSFARPSPNLQPMMLRVVMGQGEIPGDLQDMFPTPSKKWGATGKLLAGLVGLGIVAVFLFRTRKPA